MTDADVAEAVEARRTLIGRFWALWLSVWAAWCEPFDVGL